MSEKVQSPKEKSKALNNSKINLPLRNHIYTVVAAFLGVAMGVGGSVGFLTSAIHSQMMADTSALRKQLTSFKPADYTYVNPGTPGALTYANICAAPSPNIASTTPTALTTQTSTPPSTTPTSLPTPPSTPPSTTPTTPQTIIKRIISGVLNKQVATVSNTGPSSYNKVEQSNSVTTKVSNTNSFNVVNNNSQTSSSGSSKVIENTSGGSSTSGSATNNSTTSLNFSITN